MMLEKVHKKHVRLMATTLKTLQTMLQDVSQETATTLRDPNDGDKGWTTLEVVCHLRDFDGIFADRVIAILNEDDPVFSYADHEQMALDGDYNSQNLQKALADLAISREAIRDLFKSITDEQWKRTATHPEFGEWTLTDCVMQVGHHDVTHTEQIVRILAQK